MGCHCLLHSLVFRNLPPSIECLKESTTPLRTTLLLTESSRRRRGGGSSVLPDTEPQAGHVRVCEQQPALRPPVWWKARSPSSLTRSWEKVRMPQLIPTFNSTRSPAFSFCTGPYKWYSWSCSQASYSIGGTAHVTQRRNRTGRQQGWWEVLRWQNQFNCSDAYDSLQPHGLQHARPPCPSPTPRACSLMAFESVMPSTISSSVVPFSSRLQSFPASGSFLRSQLFSSGGQTNGALASVLPVNIEDWFSLGLTGLISLQSKGLSRVFSNTTVQKHPFFGASAFLMVRLSHPYMTTGKTIALTMDLCWQSNVSAF